MGGFDVVEHGLVCMTAIASMDDLFLFRRGCRLLMVLGGFLLIAAAPELPTQPEYGIHLVSD